ncbi:cellulose binding domain-containing protein [Spongiactinospora sp. TRM90649]|uniref:cellulose binding domain-containing protein n=1 Tax=Spongiactinospora sp. TRM90649 TaxID=3031114 RepID=UPI0023F75B2C|nr:cellulose binding domain-containing protein [Spongiactinospora sp. TRM90649]MDF5758672.1 cellulose binding domain-containing protein [Spongiactinospora sp. TRM90649]
MRIGTRALGAVLLTLGIFTVTLLVAALAIGSGGGTALAAAPARDVAVAKAPGKAAAAAVAGDTKAPSRPVGLRPCPVPLVPDGIGYASICWNASSDDTGVVGYDLYRLEVGGFVYASTTVGTVGGFSGELRKLYTMYVVARDAAGNVSPPSNLITVPAVIGMSPTSTPTPPPGDKVPPSKPTGLQDACLQDYHGVTFCWPPSTDNVAVTAYDVYRETATSWLKVGTLPASNFLNFTEAGLVTGQRYNYIVVARDEAGNLSMPSDPLSALSREGMPTPTPGESCTVTYRANSWSSTLNTEITVRNTGVAAIDGWTLTVDYPTSTLRLASGWSADWTQDGARFSAKNKSWNKVLAPGGSTQVGFTASFGGALPAPLSFALNGRACTTR